MERKLENKPSGKVLYDKAFEEGNSYSMLRLDYEDLPYPSDGGLPKLFASDRFHQRAIKQLKITNG